MTRTLVCVAFWLLAAAVPAEAQITLPHANFIPGTTIDSEQVDANNAALSSQALNRTGGTMSGTLTTLSLLPAINDTYDLGSTGARFQDLFLSGTLAVDTASFVVDAATNRVGIGTNAPARELTIVGNAPGLQLSSTGGGLTWGFQSLASGSLLIQDDADAVPALTFASDGQIVVATSGNAQRALTYTNTTNGATANARVQAQNNLGEFGYMQVWSSGAGGFPSGVVFGATSSAGLILSADHASGVVRFGTGGGTTRWLIDTTGHILPNSPTIYHIGSATNSVGRIFLADGAAGGPAVVFASNVDTGLYLSAPSSPVLSINGSPEYVFLTTTGSSNRLTVGSGAAAGTGNATGSGVEIARNASGNGAAGFVRFTERDAGTQYVWADATGLLRIAGAPPEEDGTPSDTSGVVVGDQTSTRASKIIFGAFTDNASALDTILQTPLWHFRYANGAYNDQEFVGITTDDSPIFSQDRGRSFNPITSFGMTVGAIKALQAEIDLLRADVAALKARE